jgi:2-oxo-4-hydroxy-4-carboxy-5-ureidoimidazoline decarboxylase
MNAAMNAADRTAPAGPAAKAPHQRPAALEWQRLAEADEPAFTAALGAIFEHAPWVARAAWAQRPFDSLATLHAAMLGALRAAPRAQQIAFLRGHPELAGKEAQAGTMTDHSTHEQAGLNALSRAEVEALRALNAAYARRHGFPFIVNVLGHTKVQIFDALRERLDHDTPGEIEAALQQIAAITWRRLNALCSGARERERPPTPAMKATP